MLQLLEQGDFPNGRARYPLFQETVKEAAHLEVDYQKPNRPA